MSGHRSFFKDPRVDSRKWLSAVGQIDECVLCGSMEALQVAHSNQDRGMGQKSDDCLTARLCMKCHTEIDAGRDLEREERRARMDRAIVLTLLKLARRGLIRPA